MFERFTERARQVVVMAQDEARTLRHDHIGTEHLLLGLIREEEGLGARVLESLGVTLEDARAKIIARVGQQEAAVEGQIPFTPRGQKVLELALREALSLGHNYIGTEHVLLGLIRENEGVGAAVLADILGDGETSAGYAERVRNEVLRVLSSPGSRRLKPEEDGKDLTDAFVREAVAFERRRQDPKNAAGGLGFASVRQRFRVRHRWKQSLRGYLVAYDWERDRCAVELIASGGLEGRFSAPRPDLVLDARSASVTLAEEPPAASG